MRKGSKSRSNLKCNALAPYNSMTFSLKRDEDGYVYAVCLYKKKNQLNKRESPWDELDSEGVCHPVNQGSILTFYLLKMRVDISPSSRVLSVYHDQHLIRSNKCVPWSASSLYMCGKKVEVYKHTMSIFDKYAKVSETWYKNELLSLQKQTVKNN